MLKFTNFQTFQFAFWVIKIDSGNFIQQNLDDIHKFYILYLLVIDMKLVLMNKLQRLSMLTDTFIENEDGTFSVTEPEGYVAVDHDGSAVKIVDRLEFSRLNFMPKNFG